MSKKALMTKRFDARFDEQTTHKLSILMQATGMTKSELVRRLILNAVASNLH